MLPEGDICPGGGLPLHAAAVLRLARSLLQLLGTGQFVLLTLPSISMKTARISLLLWAVTVLVFPDCLRPLLSNTMTRRASSGQSRCSLQVSVLASLDKDPEIWDAAGWKLMLVLAAGLETVVDDRAERPGVKLADADLIGFPWQLLWARRALQTVSQKSKSVLPASALRLP